MTPPHTNEDEPSNRRPQLDHLSHRTTAREPGRLKSFARNRYFHGKLMTARDMQLDQDYHAGRLEVFLQHVVGKGITCGLSPDVTQTTEDDDLKVTVGTGFALDCFGRPVVLTGEAYETYTPEEVSGAPLADEDTETTAGISLFLRYGECAAEKVPLPNSEDACGEECTYNRIVEDYEIVLRRGAPSHPKPVRMVEFPTEDELDTYDPATGANEHDPGLHKVATSYYESETGIPRPCRESGDPLIFLGHFTSDGDSDGVGVGWTRELDQKPRSYVFGNDMLYAAIVRHATNFENPHGVVASVEAVEPDDEGDIDLRSNSDTIAIEGLPGDNAISLDVAQAVLDRIVASVEGVDPDDDGDIDLNSPQGTLVIKPDEDAHRIDIDVAENLRGRVRTVETVEPDDVGNVDLDSPSRTITVGRRPDENRVTLDLAKSVLDRLERIEKRLDAHDRYVMDETLKYAIESFDVAADVFHEGPVVEVARALMERTREAIQDGVYRDPVSYLRALVELADMAADVRDAVEDDGRVTDESFQRYADALEELRERLRELQDDINDGSVSRTDAVDVAVLFDHLAESARWFHVIDID